MKTKITSIALFLALPALLFFCLGSLAQAFPIPPEGQAVVVEEDAATNNRGGVFIVNLINGLRILVSDFGNPAQGPLGSDPVGIALEGPNTAYVADDDGVSGDGGLYRVNLRTGQRILVSDFGNPAQGPMGSEPGGLTIDGSSAYVVDDMAGPDNKGLLFHVSLITGDRTIISDFGDPAQGPLGDNPSGIALDGNGNALVTDEEGISVLGTLFLVDLNSGQRTVISDFGDPAQGPLGQNPFGVVLDPSGNALVTDESVDKLFLVDLTPGPNLGDRTLISNFENPAQGPIGQFPQGLALESVGQVLVVDAEGGSDDRGLLFRVDTTSGDRTIISDFNAPAQGPLGSDPKGVAFRSALTARPIPTLSEWGLIATAGILGLAGIYAVRRRKLTA